MQAPKKRFRIIKLLTAVKEAYIPSQYVGFMFLHHNGTVTSQSRVWFRRACGVLGTNMLISQSGSDC